MMNKDSHGYYVKKVMFSFRGKNLGYVWFQEVFGSKKYKGKKKKQ